MSESAIELPSAIRERTLARFEQHRRAWDSNPALRTSYRDWYGMIRANLPPRERGPWVEIGSGPGFAKHFIPELLLTDIVKAPWHDHQIDAQSLPFEPGSVGALVLFDVVHHLAAPARFFAEADRVLGPGGRIVLIEPYVSPISRVVYGLFHEEPVILGVDPLALAGAGADQIKDPFTSNQAIPTLMFCRDGGREFARAFPNLAVTCVRRMAGLAFPATGGLYRRPMLPFALWRVLYWMEGLLPEVAFRLVGFRMLVVVEKR